MKGKETTYNKEVKTTMTHTNSILSYKTITPKEMKTQHGIILQTLRQTGSRTRQQLVLDTGLPINTICGRTKELLDLELVKEKGKIYNLKTNRWQTLITNNTVTP